MKLWGDNLEALRIASGTIYNEVPGVLSDHSSLFPLYHLVSAPLRNLYIILLQIIIWKVDCQYIAPLLTSPEENHTSGSSSKCSKLHYQQYKAVNIFRLKGHEGSIFRIEWSSCGSKLVSVSDDRRLISFQVLSCFFLLFSWSGSMQQYISLVQCSYLGCPC